MIITECVVGTDGTQTVGTRDMPDECFNHTTEQTTEEKLATVERSFFLLSQTMLGLEVLT